MREPQSHLIGLYANSVSLLLNTDESQHFRLENGGVHYTPEHTFNSSKYGTLINRKHSSPVHGAKSIITSNDNMYGRHVLGHFTLHGTCC